MNHLYPESFKGTVASLLQFTSLLALVSTEEWERVSGSICLEVGVGRGEGVTGEREELCLA